jgi:hypothetical protein
MPNSPVLALNAQWKISYQQTFDSPTLALVFDTSVLSGAEEALFQSYLHAWLRQLPQHPALMLIEHCLAIDNCALLFSGERGISLCEAFKDFFEQLLHAPLPEPPLDYPLTPEHRLERSFLSGILKDTPYAERLYSPSFRGMVSLPIEQLLCKLPVQLDLAIDLHFNDAFLVLAPLWSQPWVYRESSPEHASFPEGPVTQDYDIALPGVWFDIGFRIPGSASLSESYPLLLMALCEQVWATWNDNPALTLLATEVKQWQQLGYVRLRFQGERPQHIEHYRQHLWKALVFIKHQALTHHHFKDLSQKLSSERALSYAFWLDFSTQCLTVNHLCWHQSFRAALVSYAPERLEAQYPLLGYHTENTYALHNKRLRSEIIASPGRKLCYSPHPEARQAEVEVLFHSGTLFEPHGGATRLLGNLLADHLSLNSPVGWRVAWDHDYLSLSSPDCAYYIFEVAAQLQHLFSTDLLQLPVFDQWESIKRRNILKQYELELSPQDQAYRAFLKAAFPNHPYERPVDGTSQSLTLLQKHHMASLWQQFKQREMVLTLSGNIPVGHHLQTLQKVFRALPDFQERRLALPPIQSRRGVIHAELPSDYLLLGRAVPIPASEIQLYLLQFEQQLNSLFQGTPVSHEIRVFSEVWCLLFWGYQTPVYMRQVLEPFAAQLPLESAKVFEAYYLTGADWIQVSRGPERYYA